MSEKVMWKGEEVEIERYWYTSEVGWSYPTSPNAKKLGFYKTGCWTVSRVLHNPDAQPPEAIKGFREEFAARLFHTTLPY